RDELGIRRVVKRILPAGSELLLVVDQFEELFTLTPEEPHRRFLAGLTAVAAPSEDELAEAIERPARRIGVRYERGLVSQIVADVRDQPGALPLLQYALTELFAGRTCD